MNDADQRHGRRVFLWRRVFGYPNTRACSLHGVENLGQAGDLRVPKSLKQETGGEYPEKFIDAVKREVHGVLDAKVSEFAEK